MNNTLNSLQESSAGLGRSIRCDQQSSYYGQSRYALYRNAVLSVDYPSDRSNGELIRRDPIPIALTSFFEMVELILQNIKEVLRGLFGLLPIDL